MYTSIFSSFSIKMSTFFLWQNFTENILYTFGDVIWIFSDMFSINHQVISYEKAAALNSFFSFMNWIELKEARKADGWFTIFFCHLNEIWNSENAVFGKIWEMGEIALIPENIVNHIMLNYNTKRKICLIEYFYGSTRFILSYAWIMSISLIKNIYNMYSVVGAFCM